MKQTWFKFLLSLLVAALLLFGFLNSKKPNLQFATNGVLDLRQDGVFDEPIIINGEWGFAWKQFIRSEKEISGEKNYIPYPSLWNELELNGKRLTSFGYGTYYAKIILPASRQQLSLEVPESYSAYSLFVNGHLVSQNGVVGKSAAESKPYWVTKLIELGPVSDTIELALQVSNFWHYKGGVNQSIRIGTHDKLLLLYERDVALDLTLTGCLFMGGLFFLGLYLFGRHDKTILYFSLFCIVYSYRMVGVNLYVLHAIFPELPWQLTTRLEYLTLALGVALFIQYTMCLFPRESRNVFSKILFWFCVSYCILVVFTPIIVFTALLNIFLIGMFLSTAYALYVYLQAARRNRMGAVYALISTGAMMLVFLIINLNFFGIIPPFKGVAFIGYIAFFFLQSLVLSYRFAHALKNAALEAQEGLKAKSEFLSTMSHEIRTPLNAVIGMTHLIKGNNPRKDQEENLDVLLFSANNLLAIVNDILDYNKIELGKINLEQIPMDLPSIASHILAGLKELAVEKRLDLQLEVDPLLNRKIIGDPTRTGQVINNLVHNALKFTHQGSVRLNIKASVCTEESITLVISVEDTGIGISEEKQQLIFERFTQADSSTSRSYGGTGLGLAICKRILELQGSKLQLESEPGKGSRFYFTQTFALGKEKNNSSAERLIPIQENPTLLKGVSILLVEDNPFNVMVAQTILERCGTHIDVASDGKEALEKFDSSKHALILMDLHMPVMDGFEATAVLRKNGETLPIIALTASTRNEVENEVYAAGLTDVIVKPFNPDDLFRIILQHVKIVDPTYAG